MSTYEISKSSLLSLKAEILRKQEELNKNKVQNEIKKERAKNLTKLEIKNKGIEQRKLQDVNEEDDNLLRASRNALKAKAKLYDKLSRRTNFTDEELESNRRYLVRFDQKNSNDVPPEDSDGEIDFDKYPESDEERHFSDEYEPAQNLDEEWVEYVDCLGRTRNCMRKDLAYLKSKDEELRAAVVKDENKVEQLCKSDRNKEEPQQKNETENDEFNEESELLSSDMRRELLRQQWEKEEEELLKKSDIHYQDILFNEARTHGVGYYGFSKDEEERAKQQEALKKLRQETQQEQKKAQELRSTREKQLAARMKAARNRKRARMGLPLEEDEPDTIEPQEVTADEEELKKKVEEEKREQEKNAKRKKHVRPWDIGKQGVREHYEYSQEEWVDKQRKERPKEFAPPSMYQRKFRSEPKLKENDVESDKRLFFSTKKDKISNDSMVEEKEKLFVGKSEIKRSFDYHEKNSTRMESTPIINECVDLNEDEDQDRLLGDYKTSCQKTRDKSRESTGDSSSEDDTKRGKGIEIAPPPTFDYYGPTSFKKSKPSHSKEGLVDSIVAGLKFLRQQAEKKNTSKNHDSDMFLF